MTHTTIHPWLNQTKAGLASSNFHYRHPALNPIIIKKTMHKKCKFCFFKNQKKNSISGIKTTTNILTIHALREWTNMGIGTSQRNQNGK